MGIPLTTQLKDFPLRKTIYYSVNKDGKVREGQALLTHMRSYDAIRLTRYVGKLGKKQFTELMAEIHKILEGI